MRIRLGIPMSIGEIAESARGIVFGNRDRKVTHITTDSREALTGDLFIAIEGERFNGESFVNEAICQGAIPMSKARYAEGILVSDTRAALLSLTGYYIGKLRALKYKVAVTGSVGKTTTKEFLKVLLSESYKTHASEGNYNNEIGMPMSVLTAPPDTEVLICELGMNHAGEIAKMASVLRPNIAIITNIGSSHIGNLGSREAIAKAKLEVTEYIDNGVALIPKNEPLLACVKNKATFSISDAKADFSLACKGKNDITFYKNGSDFLSEKFSFSEEHLRLSLLISVATASLVNVSAASIKRGVLKISRENIRQKVISRENFNFCTDFYNSSPESVFAALDSIVKLDGFPQKSALLGDILELGEHAEAIHKEIGRRLCDYGLCRLYLFGPLSRYIRDGAVEGGFPLGQIFSNEDADSPHITAKQIRDNSTEREIILMKASRGMRLERVLDCFADSHT